jgi:non-canonical (house-cleaning) NTP pyrophosphatase
MVFICTRRPESAGAQARLRRFSQHAKVSLLKFHPLMEKILIAVGSARKPKIEAVRDALGVIRPLMDGNAEFEIVPVEVPSGVRHTPLSREDLMAGSRQRAEALISIGRQSHAPWKYFVGLEGGLDVIHEGPKRWVFLESWAYVADDTGRGAFGRSGAVLLPEALAKTVVDDGVELSEAIDAFAGGRGIRDAQGAWGVLSHNLITRQDAFRVAVISAFAPFFNREIFSNAERRAGA